MRSIGLGNKKYINTEIIIIPILWLDAFGLQSNEEYVAIILILSMSLILQFVMCQDEQEYVAYAPEHEHDSKFIIFFNYLFAIFEIKLNQLYWNNNYSYTMTWRLWFTVKCATCLL
jgi:hypothetical protein